MISWAAPAKTAVYNIGAIKVANWTGMLKVIQPAQAATVAGDVKDRIMSFMRGTSTEITPTEENRLPELATILSPGTPVYVAHTPTASFADVIRAALALRRVGLLATPHIAVRRVPNAAVLRAALAELRSGGVEHILLIAGDAARPVGEFTSTLDVLRSGILQECGISRIGVAGHPGGHSAVAADALWDALQSKQAIAARAALCMHIVTQFGLDGGAFRVWQRELMQRGIHLPVRMGIAGPASISRLAHFAIQCGIGASSRVLLRNLSAAGRTSGLAVTPDQHLLGLADMAVPAQVLGPHFFAFGGAVETARWIRKIASGAFSIDAKSGKFRIKAG
ncbi:MAG: methylenetetrahydrofolate reductase [Gammaproteobacteria bacterium]